MIKFILLVLTLIFFLFFIKKRYLLESYQNFKKITVKLTSAAFKPSIIKSGSAFGLYSQYANLLNMIYPLQHIHSRGSFENIKFLLKNDKSIVISQSDIALDVYFKKTQISNNQDDIRLIANLFYENPILIVNKLSNISSWKDLKGKKIIIGKKGSGSRYIALKLLKLANIKLSELNILDINPYNLDLINKCMKNRELDAIFYMIENPNILIKKLSNKHFIDIIGPKGINSKLILSRFPTWKHSKIDVSDYNITGKAYTINTFASPVYLLTNKYQEDKVIYKLLETILLNRLFIINNLKYKLNKKSLENISPSEIIENKSSITLHSGVILFLKNTGISSYNNNKKCYLFAGSGKCNEEIL
jgi:uncharacterized protein